MKNKKAQIQLVGILIIIVIILSITFASSLDPTKLSITAQQKGDVVYNINQDSNNALRSGEFSLEVKQPILKCTYNPEILESTIPDENNPECWEVEVVYNGKTFKKRINYGLIEIDDGIKVRVDSTAKSRYNENLKKLEVVRYSHNINIFFDNLNLKTIYPLQNRLIKFNSDGEIKVALENNFNTGFEGGLTIKQDRLLFFTGSEIKTIKDQTINKGLNNYDVSVSTDQLGTLDIRTTPFITFTNNKDFQVNFVFDGESQLFEVAPEVNGELIGQIINEESTTESVLEELTIIQKISLWFNRLDFRLF